MLHLRVYHLTTEMAYLKLATRTATVPKQRVAEPMQAISMRQAADCSGASVDILQAINMTPLLRQAEIVKRCAAVTFVVEVNLMRHLQLFTIAYSWAASFNYVISS